MLFQAVRNEQRGLVVGSLIPKPKDPKFESRHETAKKTKKKQVSVPPIPYSSAAERHQTSSVNPLDLQGSERLMVIAL
jgi:hypothetical protein